MVITLHIHADTCVIEVLDVLEEGHEEDTVICVDAAELFSELFGPVFVIFIVPVAFVLFLAPGITQFY